MIVVIAMAVFANVSVLFELYHLHIASDDDDTDIIPDSGATSIMRCFHSDFKDDYQACTDVFVLMGDASRIHVAGYSTSQMKIDGNVRRIVNSLHVPLLDSDLFSVTKRAHGHWLFFLS